MKKEPINIVLTTWKREDICLETLMCLEDNTKTDYRSIIIDNGSSTEFEETLNAGADVYVRFDENKGLEAAKHIGMELVESEYFISTDNDILVPKPEVVQERYPEADDWLDALITLFEQNKKYKAIALRPQVLVGTGDIFGDNPPDVKEFSHVPGYMRIMDTKVVKELGAWEDKRPLRGHEEYWISNRMNEAGYKVGWASYIPCYHVFGDKNWGYKDMKPEEHGHNPTNLPQDDWDEIREKFL